MAKFDDDAHQANCSQGCVGGSPHLAPLVRGPWRVGFCPVLYVLHTLLVCCTQLVTDHSIVTSLSMAAFRCSLRGGDGGIARCTLALANMKLRFRIPLGN